MRAVLAGRPLRSIRRANPSRASALSGALWWEAASKAKTVPELYRFYLALLAGALRRELEAGLTGNYEAAHTVVELSGKPERRTE